MGRISTVAYTEPHFDIFKFWKNHIYTHFHTIFFYFDKRNVLEKHKNTQEKCWKYTHTRTHTNQMWFSFQIQLKVRVVVLRKKVTHMERELIIFKDFEFQSRLSRFAECFVLHALRRNTSTAQKPALLLF